MAEELSDDRHKDRVRSDLLLDIFSSDFTISENLGKKAAADGLAAMDWNHGATTVLMAEKVVATLDANHSKAKAAKYLA